MNKKTKSLLILGSAILGAVVFTGCSANFCSVDDKARILYKYDSGLSYDSEGQVQYNEDGNLVFANDTVTKMVATLGSTYDIPSAEFFVKLDEKTLDLATTAAAAAGNTYEKEADLLYNYGYLRYAGTTLNKKGNEVQTLFANFDKMVDEINTELPSADLPGESFVDAYKAKLSTYVSGVRTCITPTDGFYGKDGDLFIEGKTWGDAWKKGVIEGLVIYPVAWMADVFAGAFTNGGMTAGWAALVSILLCTIIIRGLMMAATFKSTMAQQKMSLLQPELAKIQAKYPNANTNQYEKQRMAQDQMALYKKNKINPMSQIIVLIIQFPIFIGVWGALSGAACLSTGSVFGLFLSDSISSVITTWKFNGAWWTAAVLFILMSAAQIISSRLPIWLQKKETKKVSKLSANPAQDQQQKTMKFMQVFMIIMIIFMGFTLPSGMGVYWLIGALVSMGQTLITQRIMKKKKKD